MAKKEPQPLTNRQQSVFDLLRSGMTPNEIAERLDTSSTNIYGHMRKIKDKGHRIPRATQRRTASGRKRRATAGANGKPNGAARIDGPPTHIRKAVEAVKAAIDIEARKAEEHRDRMRKLKAELESEEQQAQLSMTEMDRLGKAEKDLVGA